MQAVSLVWVKERPHPAECFCPQVRTACGLIQCWLPSGKRAHMAGLGFEDTAQEGCAWVQSLCSSSKHGAEIPLQDCCGHRGCTASMPAGQASCTPDAESMQRPGSAFFARAAALNS